MIAQVYHWSSLTALVVGGWLNAITIWMIGCHTPAEMRVYSRLLVQTFFF
jgi:hypothetical protein